MTNLLSCDIIQKNKKEGFAVAKVLSKILILIGIVVYTIILFNFLEMTINYKIALLISDYLMCIGISISSITEEEK